MSEPKKFKIFNDPVHGFISIPFPIIFDLIEHPWYQRLRRISQLGLTNLVYSGANHSRFQHAMGAMHLMTRAIDSLKLKGVEITEQEAEAVCVAILLHDIGHGPFSHTLENSIIENMHHETVSLRLMESLNDQFGGKLGMAIEVFNGEYHKAFLHELVSSQLDMDRLDYLKRDSFFTGVSEGVVGSERIIQMLNVADGHLCVEAKGIYSVEKFLIARRLMYWQVYLHKTVVGAEFLLMKIMQRARELSATEKLECSTHLSFFLCPQDETIDLTSVLSINHFTELDDVEILAAIKTWQSHDDKVLSALCQRLIQRKLLKVEVSTLPISELRKQSLVDDVVNSLGVSENEASYFVFEDEITNRAYSPNLEEIKILMKDGSITDISQAADILNTNALSESQSKYFLCYPKGLA